MRKFVLCCLVLCAGQAALAQSSDPSGGAFLRITPMARPLAMGNAYTGVAEGIEALHFNPAGILSIDQWDVGLSHILYPFDLSYSYAAVAKKFNPKTVGAIHLAFLGGEDEFRDAGGNVTGQFSNHDLGFGLSVAHQIAPEIILGGTVRIINSEIAQASANSVGFDFGVKYLPLNWKGLSIGASVLNVGPGLDYDGASSPQPLSGRVGVAWQPPTKRYTVAADLSLDRDASARAHIGGEYRVLESFSLRGGFDVGADASFVRALKLGMGFHSRVGSFDYAFERQGFGNNHRISYSYLGGRPREAEAKDTGDFFGGFVRRPGTVRVAITPFVNLSPAAEHDWLAEGFREIFRARFSRQPGIALADDNVRYFIEGRFSPIGADAYWVGVKIIDAQTGMSVAFKEAQILQNELLGGTNTFAGAVAAAIPLR